MSTDNFLFKKMTYQVIGCAMEVHNELGPGFLEKVYENALMVALKNAGINAEQQVSIKVHFQQQVVGDFYADILVDKGIILELKCCKSICDEHRAQLLNYLKTTGIKVGYIVNFGEPKLTYERFVF